MSQYTTIFALCVRKPIMSDLGVSYSTIPKLRQVLILGFCRSIEPIAYASIGPYVYFMMQDFGYESPETILSLCTFAQVSFGLGQIVSSLFWVRIADRYGRKPSLTFGLMGSVFCTVLFGFSCNAYMAISARFAAGLVNGCVMLARTMAGDIVANKRQYKNHVFSILVVGTSLGYTIGPLFTGSFANPVDKYPDIFGDYAILKQFPYLLSNLLPAPAFTVAIIAVLLFVEETDHSSPHVLLPKEKDPMLKLGNVIRKWCKGTEIENAHEYEPISTTEEHSYGSMPTSPGTWSTKNALLRPVVITVVCHTLNFTHCTFYLQLLPFFLSTPRADPESSQPSLVKFGGGLGMESQEIGVIMCIIGLFGFILQLTLYPVVSVRKGSINAYRIGLAGFLAYIFVPYLAIVPDENRQLLVTLLGILGSSLAVGTSFTFPALDVLTTNASPHYLLNMVNGMVQVGQSLGRVVGPVIFGNLFAFGVGINMVGLAWWIMAGVVLAQFAVSRML